MKKKSAMYLQYHKEFAADFISNKRMYNWIADIMYIPLNLRK